MKRFLYALIPLVIVAVLCVENPGIISIALFPISLCGMLSGIQLHKTIESSNFSINVYFYVWIFVFISTFVAPLIHFYYGFWIPYMSPRPDSWNNYAFIISMMNLFGILIWQFIFRENADYVREKQTKWELNRYWKFWIFIFLLISLLAQLYVYYKFGGVLAYIHAFTISTEGLDAFEGMGAFFILSESFPYTLIVYIILKYRKQGMGRFKFYFIFVILFFITLFFGGLRGSRSNTALFMVISVIAMDIYIYKVKKGDMLLLLIGFFLFMYLGRMYKDYGENMLQESTTVLQANTNLSSVETTIIGDLARYDVNAYELFILDEVRPNYRLRWGETYLWGLLTYVPGGKYIIKTFHLKGRSPAAAELFFGFQDIKNSRILGPIGEWFLNFGRSTFFFIYFILGFFIRQIRKYTLSLSVNDIRFLIVPSLIVFIPQLILSDFSNICFFFVKRVVVTFILLYLISERKVATT